MAPKKTEISVKGLVNAQHNRHLVPFKVTQFKQILTGIGDDELLEEVPNPMRVQLKEFARKLTAINQKLTDFMRTGVLGELARIIGPCHVPLKRVYLLQEDRKAHKSSTKRRLEWEQHDKDVRNSNATKELVLPILQRLQEELLKPSPDVDVLKAGLSEIEAIFV